VRAAVDVLSHVGLVCCLGLFLAGCTSGNVHTAGYYGSPAAPTVRNRTYDPYAAYASSAATWSPAAADRHGTIVKPADSYNQWDRPDYEHSKWAADASGSTAGSF
jgi:hypothetical protein